MGLIYIYVGIQLVNNKTKQTSGTDIVILYFGQNSDFYISSLCLQSGFRSVYKPLTVLKARRLPLSMR